MKLWAPKVGKSWRFSFCVAVILSVGFGLACMPGKASAVNSPGNCTGASHLGRVDCNGFFTNQLVDIPTEGSVVIPAGFDSVVGAKDYIQLMKQYLNSNDEQEHISAAFTIAVMLGEPYSTFGGSAANGVAWARANFTRWSDVINYYDSNGLVDWNTPWSTNTPYEDSGYGRNIRDNYYVTYEPTSADLIVFRVPPGYTGNAFRIDRFCGNIQGANRALVVPPTAGISGNINPPTPGTPPGVAAGDPDKYSTCQQVTGHATDGKDPNYAVQVRLRFSVGSGGPTDVTASTTGTHLFSAPTPQAVRDSLTPVTVTVDRVRDSANKDTTFTPSTIILGPCRTITAGSCSGITEVPGQPEPNTSFSLSAAVQYASMADAQNVASQPGVTFNVTIDGPVGPTSTTIFNGTVPISPNPPNDQYVRAQKTLTLPQAGTYNVGWQIVGPTGATQCGSSIPPGPSTPPPPTVSAYNRPFFSVLNGDINAGATITPAGSPACSESPPAPNGGGIVSWNRDPANGDYSGSGTQYAAYTLMHLQEFATAQGSAASPKTAGQPVGLSFSSTGLTSDVAPAAGLYGGKFGGTECIADYYANATPATTSPTTNLSSLLTPTKIPGYLGLGVIPNKTNFVHYVDGDLYVDTNIAYAGAALGYADTSDIPVFALIVKGNIYIQPNVTQLDGFYIAQPSTAQPTKGIIYTCAPAGFTGLGVTLLKRTLQNSCNKQLTVNGSAVAKQIWLLRTSGTVSDNTPAEIFNYSPEAWLTKPAGNSLSAPVDQRYDAFSNQAPAL